MSCKASTQAEDLTPSCTHSQGPPPDDHRHCHATLTKPSPRRHQICPSMTNATAKATDPLPNASNHPCQVPAPVAKGDTSTADHLHRETTPQGSRLPTATTAGPDFTPPHQIRKGDSPLSGDRSPGSGRAARNSTHATPMPPEKRHHDVRLDSD
jgi:hypothetical protein